MTQAAATGEFVEVEGLKTFYVHRGEGPPIIAIHGGSPGACALINWGANIEPWRRSDSACTRTTSPATATPTFPPTTR